MNVTERFGACRSDRRTEIRNCVFGLQNIYFNFHVLSGKV